LIEEGWKASFIASDAADRENRRRSTLPADNQIQKGKGLTMPTKTRKQKDYEADQARDQTRLDAMDRVIADPVTPNYAVVKATAAANVIIARMESRRCAYYGVKPADTDSGGFPTRAPNGKLFSELGPSWHELPAFRRPTLEETRAADLKRYERNKAERAALVAAGDKAGLARWEKEHGIVVVRENPKKWNYGASRLS
jgi:hypothetical protein